MRLAIFRDNPLRNNLYDVAIHRLHILLHQCLQIPIPRTDTPTSRRPFRDNKRLELFVAGAESTVHFFSYYIAKCVGSGGALLEHAEYGVYFCFDFLAELKEVVGIFEELLFVCIGERILPLSGLFVRVFEGCEDTYYYESIMV